MQHITTPDRTFPKQDSTLVKRMPLGVLSFADNRKPPSSQAPEPGILCKRIDNTAHVVDLNQNAITSHKFTPLAIPVEHTKKKNPHSASIQGKIMSTEPVEFLSRAVFTENIPFRTEASDFSRTTHSYPIRQQQNQALASSATKSLSKGKKKENVPQKEKVVARKKSPVKKVPAKTATAGFKERPRSSPKAAGKKAAPEAKPPQPPKKIEVRPASNPVKKEERENIPPPANNLKKKLQKITAPTSPKKPAKPVKNERSKSTKIQPHVQPQPQPQPVPKHEKTESSVQKDPKEASDFVEEFVQHNAIKILEEMKEQKRQQEFERRLMEERKMALEEGNRRIREANFKRFNLQQRAVRPKVKVAWGVDQRKFSRPHNSVESPSKAQKTKVIDDDERRKRLGLDHLNEEQLNELKKRTLLQTLKADELDQSQDLNKKRQVTQEEHENLQRYMVEKKLRMDHEMYAKKVGEYEDFERKKQNLERLFNEIRDNRARTAKSGKKKSGKKKGRKGKHDISISRIPPTNTEANEKQFGTQDSEEEENYSLLYDEYRKIIKSKRSNRDDQREGAQGKLVSSGPTQQSPDAVVMRYSHDRAGLSTSQQMQQDIFEQKKEDYKKKFNEISNRYQKNIATTNMQVLENQQLREERPSEHRRTHKTGDRHEAQKVIMEMETDNFSENDYLGSDSLVINSAHQRVAKGDSDESQEQSLPENSAREIIEAAAIFIQKNYRGYRTRKILREYILQLCQEDAEMEGLESDDEEGHGARHHHGEEYEDEEGEEVEQEDEDGEVYLQHQGFRNAAIKHIPHQEKPGHKGGKVHDDEDDEDYEEAEGEGVIIEDENFEFIGDDEKQSLRSLLEKQRLGLHEEYNKDFYQNEEEEGEEEEGDEDEEGSQRVLGGHSNEDDYQKLREQYHKFYEDDDLKGEGEEDYDEEEAELRRQEVAALRRAQQQEQDEEEEREEREGSEVEFAIELPRRAKSDGEIIAAYQFTLDDSEDDNNISLHSGGEDYYPAANKQLQFGSGERDSQGKNFEELRRSEQAERSTVKTKQQQEEEEHEEPEEEGEELEYEEEYDAGQDPRIQQQYYQMYGQKYGYQEPHSENDSGNEYPDEEGYVHESDYEPQESGRDVRPSHGQQEDQEIEVDYEDDDQHTHQGEEEEEEDSGHIEHGEEPEEAYSAEQARYFHQKDSRVKSVDVDNEKHVMVSHINSEDDPEAAYQMPETPDTQLYKNLYQQQQQQQRRHKSDFVMPENRHSMNVQPEERRSLPYTHNKTVSRGEGGRYSQSEDPYKQKRSEQVSELEQYEEEGHEEYEEEEPEYEEIEENVEDHGEHRADSEHYREELIEELNQGDRKSHHSKRSSQRESPQRVNRSHEKTLSQSSENTGKYAVTILPPEEKKVEVIIDHKYQEELARLKEEEARKWNEMVKQLGQLQGVSLSADIKAVVENLQKQSEINKRKLIESEGDQSSSMLPAITNDTILSEPVPLAYKKLEVPSPLQEGKYAKKKKPFGKKSNLQIDINAANEDSQEAGEAAGLNLDLSQMRLVLGSEQLLREQSARTLSQSVSAQSDGDSVELGAEGENTGIFERDPFKEFTSRKFKELMQQENMKNLIEMRERALEIRHKTHLDHMKKMFENRRFSPRTFQNKQIELEKWITKEREIIHKTKKDIETGWISTADSIQRTQRDLQFLQKILGANTEGRNTNGSDISLRHSFTDEEYNENADTQSERLSKRSFLALGNEIRSPSSSKNIKIIDKFELKDHLFSPQLNTSAPSRKEQGDEIRIIEGDREIKPPENRNLLEAMGKAQEIQEENYELEVEDVDKEDEQNIDFITSGSQDKETHDKALAPEDILINAKSGRQVIQDRKDHYRKDSPIKVDQSEDVEINPEGEYDEDIVWEKDVLESPLIKQDRHHEKQTSPRTSSIKKDLLSPSNLVEPQIPSLSSVYSPKSQEELRNMFQEKINIIKQEHVHESEQPLEELGEEEEPHVEEEQHHEDNIQARTDLICKDLVENLFEEFAEELTRADQERIREKVILLGEEPPAPTINLQNLIENNHFFHAGAEHPNFQANIPMPLSPSPEQLRLQSLSPAKENELTAEQQIKDAQEELLRTLGIRTEIASVARYLDLLLEEINGQYKEIFLRNINTPLGYSTSEKLNNMRNYDLGSSEGSSLAMSSVDSQLILEIQLYFKVEERIMEENPNKNEVSTELEHIHNKMIFDCVNELLDSYRPYGLNGQPFPWKAGSKAIKALAVTEENLEKTLEKVKAKVLEWAAYLCGYYGEGDEFIQDKNQSFIDEYLAQVREERILRMLSEEIFEMENKWITYDDEEAEVELEIADLVFDKIVTETAELIAQINEKKKHDMNPSSHKLVASPGQRRLPTRIGYSDVAQIETDANFNSI